MLPAFALILIVIGVGHFLWISRFVPRDALWLVINVPIAAISLALCDFLHFRTRLPIWIFGIVLLAIAIVSAHFSIALGIIFTGLAIFNRTK